MEAQALMVNGRCSNCRYQLTVIEEGVYAVIKAAVIKADLKDKKVYAKCPKCKKWFITPLLYLTE